MNRAATTDGTRIAPLSRGLAIGVLAALAMAEAMAGSGGIVPEWARPPGADAPDPAARPRPAPGRAVLPRPAPAPPAAIATPPQAVPVAPDAAATRPGLMQRVDSWQGSLERGVTDTVRRFDRFFGDEELDDDNDGTRVRFALGFRLDADEGLSFENRFRVRLALPNLENQLQIVADNMVNAEDAWSKDAIEEAARASKPDAGLRYIMREDETRRISADAGLRLGGNPQVFGKLRGRLIVPFDPWEMRLVQTVQWYSHDGFGETSEMRWSRILSAPGWMFQSSTRIGWQEDRSGVTPSQSFTWQHTINGEWGNRFTLFAEWPETPSTTEASYALEFGHRRLIHSDWLFFEVSPGVDFSQTRDYEPNGYITCLLEVSFDHRP